MVEVLEEEEMEKELQEIESKGGSQKAYETVKLLKKKKPKKNLNIFDTRGNVCNTDQQKVDILTKHFNQVFHRDDQETPDFYPPCKNNPPFSLEEIKNATNKLKNGKCSGIDNVSAEMLKNSPDVIYNVVAESSIKVLKLAIT